jgi:hypothetical protein
MLAFKGKLHCVENLPPFAQLVWAVSPGLSLQQV